MWWLPTAHAACPSHPLHPWGCPHPYGGVRAPGVPWGCRGLAPSVFNGAAGAWRHFWERVGLFVLGLPIWQRKASAGCQRDAVAGHAQGSVLWAGSKAGSPRAAALAKSTCRSLCLWGTSIPQHPTVPARGTCEVSPLRGGLPGLKALVAHHHVSPMGLGYGARAITGGPDRAVPCPSSTGSSDPYCIVKIDDEAIIR